MSLFDQLLHNYFYHIRNLFNNKDSKHQIRLLFCCNFDNFVFFPFGINLKITEISTKTIVGEPLTLLFQTPKTRALYNFNIYFCMFGGFFGSQSSSTSITFCTQLPKRAVAEVKRWTLHKEGYNLETLPDAILTVSFDAPSDSIFTGLHYKLRIKFTSKYPFEPPEVQFVVDTTTKAPIHPHIYTNGHICLSILTPSAWSPALTVESTVLSIASLLSSCTTKTSPEGNQSYVSRVGDRSPLLTTWAFHDDKV